MDGTDFERLYTSGALSEPKAALRTVSARELQLKDMPPVRFAVEGLIPAGLSILASPPKYGKSWLVLDLCLSVAAGKRFLGFSTNRSGCLYLALEDSERRLKTRMDKLLYSRPAPEGFYFATEAQALDNGLLDALEAFLAAHGDVRLIVLDTYQRIRGAAQGREGAYSADYRETGALKAFADRHNVALLLVHHLRKMRDDGDPFAMISGTTGISGAADTMLVLIKENRSDSSARFAVVGRDVESLDAVLRFDRETCRWANLGDADAFAEQQRRSEYMASPITLTLRKLARAAPAGLGGHRDRPADRRTVHSAHVARRDSAGPLGQAQGHERAVSRDGRHSLHAAQQRQRRRQARLHLRRPQEEPEEASLFTAELTQMHN